MKKVFFILIMVLTFGFNSFAQESATYDKYLGYMESWFEYAPATTVHAHTATDSIWYFTCLKESYFPVKYDIKVKLHKVSGTTRVTPVILQAKKFDSDAWTTLSSVKWSTGVDTTKRFTEITTYQQYRFFRITMTAPLKGTIIDVQELSEKFWQ
jgi:hypothetical protein